jgi:hypothetical protein
MCDNNPISAEHYKVASTLRPMEACMMRQLGFVLLLAVGCAFTAASWADDLVKDAAIGGAIGGALGGAVGAEVGGKNGAIVGAGVGAATGAAIATSDDDDHDGHHDGHHADAPEVVIVPAPQQGHFCPPGQAKKNRC